MQDLVDCMGINRGSLHATFGDKRRLFIQALRHYDAREHKAWVAALAAANSPRGSILAGFDGAVSAALDPATRDGEIPDTVEAGEAARSLLGLFIGLRVLSRSRPEPALLRSLRHQAEALIG